MIPFNEPVFSLKISQWPYFHLGVRKYCFVNYATTTAPQLVVKYWNYETDTAVQRIWLQISKHLTPLSLSLSQIFVAWLTRCYLIHVMSLLVSFLKFDSSFQDPNFTLDERRPVTGRRRLYSTGDVVEVMKEESEAASSMTPPIQIPVIKLTDHETIKEEEDRPKPRDIPPRRRKTSAPPRFCFFDYSMIPDKDPRYDCALYEFAEYRRSGKNIISSWLKVEKLNIEVISRRLDYSFNFGSFKPMNVCPTAF